MSWSFSQVLVAEYLAGNYLDTVPCAPLSTTPTPDQYYWPDKPTEFSRLSRFGTMCEPLTGNRGAELLTLFLEASRARTYPLQAVGTDWTENVVDSGGRWRESLAKYDPATHSLKTAQLSLIEDWTGCSVILPRSGLMLDGQCWELPTLGRITRETESGFLPTPVSIDAGSGRFNTSIGGKPRPTLALMAKRNLWPTPTAQMDKKARGNPLKNAEDTIKRGFSLGLPEVVAWRQAGRMCPTPTPTAHNAKETNAPSEANRNTPTLAAQAGGSLNPNWVEWLMGWPIGHTDLKQSETDKFPNVAQPHGVCSEVTE